MSYTYKGEKIKLHGMFQYAAVIEPSMMSGGHNGETRYLICNDCGKELNSFFAEHEGEWV